MEYPHLKNAPIREAIIDIRVKHRPNFSISEFRDIHKFLKPDYPLMEERKATIFHLQADSIPQELKQESELDGIAFLREDRKELVQFTKHGFTFNKLEPYTDWDDILTKTKKAWSIYLEKSKPVSINRIATRFINNLVFPLPVDLGKYLTNPPNVPVSGPHLFSNSLNRITLIDESKNISVHFTQIIETKEGTAAIIIDLDAFKDSDIDVDYLWVDFKNLRDMKNKLFFSSLTENAINIYK